MRKSKVPVLYIIFNRIDTVKKSFESIRRYKPTVLYIAADGPRNNAPEDNDKCQEVRRWVINNIDWDCKVKTKFRDENVGCGYNPKEAIDWLFENEEYGIILEDDCVVSDSFFPFMHQMLEKYKHNPKISIVCGSNFDFQRKYQNKNADYFFSKFPYTWGWGTWRRTWSGYDFQMKKWNNPIRKSFTLKWSFKKPEYREFWRYVFDETYKNQPTDLWDYQFFFLCFSRRQYSIVPNVNLVSNIGTDLDATHTANYAGKMNIKTFNFNFPLNMYADDKVYADFKENGVLLYDEELQRVCFGAVQVTPFYVKLKRKIKRMIYFWK